MTTDLNPLQQLATRESSIALEMDNSPVQETAQKASEATHECLHSGEGATGIDHPIHHQLAVSKPLCLCLSAFGTLAFGVMTYGIINGLIQQN